MHRQQISDMIDQSPMNRGLSGADWLADERNVVIADGDDVIMFDYEDPGKYQFHWLTSSKGRSAVEKAKRAIKQMLDGPADILFGIVPVSRPDVRLMARLIGAKYVSSAEIDGEAMQIFIMTREIREGAVH